MTFKLRLKGEEGPVVADHVVGGETGAEKCLRDEENHLVRA